MSIKLEKDPSLKSLLLQEALRARGYNIDIDNWWGKNSEKAYQDFKKQWENQNIPSAPKSDYPNKPNKSINFEELKDEYQKVFDACIVEKVDEVDLIVNKIAKNESIYQEISDKAGGEIPWYLIGIIHNMECSLSFKKHLHNGDPLTKRTVNVPAGRPKNSSPPFTFQESAVDALKYDGLDKVSNWDIPKILYNQEKFNGFGYRKYKGIFSPYLWSGSNIYKKGKYTSDGKYDPNAVSKQIGAAVILKRMKDRNLI